MKRITFTAYEVTHDGDVSLTTEAIKKAGGTIVAAQLDYEEESMRVTVDLPDGLDVNHFRMAYGEAGGC